MSTLIIDPLLETRLREERKLNGGDRFDDVWEGTYAMAPLADNEHQELQSRLTSAIRDALGWDNPARVLAGANISDQVDQ